MKNRIIEFVEKHGKREFDPNETMGWLRSDLAMFWSWGVSEAVNVKDKALLLHVNGALHKGIVYVVLDWMDVYEVYIVDENHEIIEHVSHVYCDMLAEQIDVLIETKVEV